MVPFDDNNVVAKGQPFSIEGHSSDSSRSPRDCPVTAVRVHSAAINAFQRRISRPSRKPPRLIADCVRACLYLGLGLAGLGGFGNQVAAGALPFSDAFANRGVIAGATGSGSGNNTGATREANEPQHGGLPGSASIWLSWIAPSDGLVTFNTAGSSIDPLLGVYAYDRALKGGQPGPQDPSKPFADLKQVARAEGNQGGGSLNPGLLTLGVRAGIEYELAVDGYAGAIGEIRFDWNFKFVADLIPIIVLDEPDRALRIGDRLQLTAQVTVEAGAKVKYQWLLNDQELLGQEDPTLVIPFLTADQVGSYKLRLKAGRTKDGQLIWFSVPVEIQVNSEGQTNALARDRLFDALISPLTPDDRGRGDGGGGPNAIPRRRATLAANPIGVARGYNGTQIFNTIYAGRDPAEPLHCGLIGGASYWFAYEAPADGVVQLNTDGSTYDTILATYTYQSPLTNYAGLIPIACDHTAGPSGAGAVGSHVRFRATRARTYLVVVDGFNGAKGNARLNYSLATNSPVDPPNAPGIGLGPTDFTVREGGAILWTISVTGTAPLTLSWWHDGALVPGQTSTNLFLSQVLPGAAGSYLLVVTNVVGSVTSAPIVLRVLVAPVLQLQFSAATNALSFPTERGLRYRLESSNNLGPQGWRAVTNGFGNETGFLLGTGSPAVLPAPQGETLFFRVQVE